VSRALFVIIELLTINSRTSFVLCPGVFEETIVSKYYVILTIDIKYPCHLCHYRVQVRPETKVSLCIVAIRTISIIYSQINVLTLWFSLYTKYSTHTQLCNYVLPERIHACMHTD